MYAVCFTSYSGILEYSDMIFWNILDVCKDKTMLHIPSISGLYSGCVP
jgi:hypothetical protein